MKKSTMTPEERADRKRQTQKEYLKRTNYNKTHMQQVLLTLHKENEADMIDWLNQQDNRNGYIKDLIRRDMEAYQEAMKHENL